MLTPQILITMLYETYYTALYFGASPRAWNTSFRQLTARVKLPEGDNDTGAASASASEGPVPTHLDVPEGSEDSDDLPPDAPVPVITTAHGSVIQPYDLFMALRVLGAIFAAITLAGAILTFNSETCECSCRRVY